MNKKKLGRPPKKKPIESFVKDDVLINEDDLPKPVIGPVVAICDCGDPAHSGSVQCWKCSHRA